MDPQTGDLNDTGKCISAWNYLRNRVGLKKKLLNGLFSYLLSKKRVREIKSYYSLILFCPSHLKGFFEKLVMSMAVNCRFRFHKNWPLFVVKLGTNMFLMSDLGHKIPL